MRGRTRFPIRIKILVAFLLVVTAVVSVITYALSSMVHEDKSTYIRESAMMFATSISEEYRSVLIGYVERLQAYSRILGRTDLPEAGKEDLLDDLFGDFRELIAVSIYHQGEEAVSAYDTRTLDEAKVTREQLEAWRREHPLPLDEIAAGRVFVENSTVNPSLPSLTIAVSQRLEGDDEPAVIAAVVRLDAMQQIASRSGIFNIYLVDSAGKILASRDRAENLDPGIEQAISQVGGFEEASVGAASREFLVDGVPRIGAVAKVDPGGVRIVAEIPASAARIASQDLLRRVLFYSMALLVFSAVMSLFIARRITRPVERLSEATREIAKGEFDTRVEVDSWDEIGGLAGSFNQMATELRQREEALKETQSQLVQSEKLAAFGQLGAGIAHEVKNPLAGILGCAQLSLRKTEPGSPLETNLQLIEKETRRCKTIIENLLKFARQEKAHMETMNLNTAVEDAIAIVNHQLEMQRVHVEKSLAQELPSMVGSANQLQQVFMNLMMNAQQAMEGNPGVVKVSTERYGEAHLEVRVSDNGPGIPKEIQRKIFEPFFTTKPNGKGTGLGLSVSFGIIKDHGGEIELESEVGKGTTFVIRLPLALAHSGHDNVAETVTADAVHV